MTLKTHQSGQLRSFDDDVDELEVLRDKAIKDKKNHKGLFVGHVLNTDENLAQYLPYNEVFYPKLFESEAVSGQDLWVAGFLDRASRPDDLNEKLTRAKKHQTRKESEKEKKKEKKTPDTVNHEFNLSPSPSPIRKMSLNSSLSDSRNSNNDDDLFRKASQQKALARVLKPYLNSVGNTHTLPKSSTKTGKKVIHSGIIRPNQFSSKELENIFEIQKHENIAAKIIQNFICRRKRIRLWRHLVSCVMKVPIIQKCVRGMITRKLVSVWYKARVKVAIIWQAYARKLITKIRLRVVFALELMMIVRIQKIVRGKFGRVKFLRILRDRKATRIQATWRGIVSGLELGLGFKLLGEV
jgi:hypothetical protein